MKIKKIRIKSVPDFFDDLQETAIQLDQGKTPKLRRGEFFDSLEAVRNMLTENRLTLWRVIRDQKPNSISELAKWVDRDFKNVHQDIHVLVTVGLVQLTQKKGKRGDVQKPTSLADKLRVEVA